MEEQHKEYCVTSLKTNDEYIAELKAIHEELGCGIATGTLISTDLELLTRADEIVVILDFLAKNGGKDNGSKN